MPAATDASVESLVREALPRLIDLRHDLHAHPELGYQETYASGVIQRELAAAEIPFQAGLASTGVVGWIMPSDQAAAARPAVGLRADMDALPITEQTELPYASLYPGRMHACGHDGHMTVLLGVACVLARLRHRLPRPVKLIFQPAEEGGAGARKMIDEGALSDAVGPCRVAMMLGIHGMPLLPVGSFASRPGPLLAATSNFQITVRGAGGHGAMPHLTADPIVAAAAVVTGLQSIVSRNVDPTDPAVVTVGSLHAGTTHNVIPATAELVGTFRTVTPAAAELIARRVREVAQQISAAHRCTAEVSIVPGYPVTRNDRHAYQYAMSVARRVLSEQRVHEAPVPIMGGEDFSFYGETVPSCFGFLGVRPADRDDYPGLHTSHYDFTDEAIPHGVMLMTRWALDANEI